VDERALDDPRCLVTSDALVIDGANGVCPDARIGQANAGLASFVALLIASLLAALVLTRVRLPARARAMGLFALATLASLPGWYALATTRADAPHAVAHTSAEIAALHDALRDFALRRGCAEVRENTCVACEPIARLALSGITCERAATIVLRDDALGGHCIEHADALICGGTP
jgi:hypothetical protein